MHRARLTFAVLALILHVFRGVHAEEPGLKLRLQPELIPYSLGRDDPTDVFLDADSVEGREDEELDATGGVRLRKRGAALFADHLHLTYPEKRVTATGNVRLEREGDVVTSELLFYDLDTDSGYADDAGYFVGRFGTRGTARHLVAEDRDRYRIEKATFTNCEVGNDDWFMRVDRLDLDRQRDIGVARDATVVFKGVPFLYSPYLDFSLSGRRKTGLLPPSFGSTGQSGFEFTQPFYWNIAPNYDATIAPRVLAKRGVLMNSDFRYLEPDMRGEMRGEYLPDDRQKDGEKRYGFLWQHTQNFGNGFTGLLDLQGVSDDTYFTDLSDKIQATSQTNLNREGDLFFDGGWWSVNTRVQRYQTLQDPLAPVVPPYARLPQITLNMNRQTDLLDFAMQGEYVDFSHPFLLNARRETLYPSVSLPIRTSYFYVTPKVGYHTTSYSFEDPNLPDQTRNLPIYSVDSGLTFERDTDFFGRAFLQTLEPRLYYVYIPFRPQNQLPIFDTALADFNLAQIFTENQFSGGDRINDANQVTAAVTSRLIDPATGNEQLRVTLGQRYYFKEQEVSLTPELRKTSRSDVLAAVTGQVTNHWFTDVGVQYSTNDNKFERSNARIRYQPEPGKAVNFGYRFTRDALEQLDLSAEWPIHGRWTGLFRYDYSLQDRKLLEGLVGVEYNAGCWAARVVLHRFVSATQEYVNAMFFQLEFTGISRIGSSPLEVLRQGISGYQPTNPKTPPEFNPFPAH